MSDIEKYGLEDDQRNENDDLLKEDALVAPLSEIEEVAEEADEDSSLYSIVGEEIITKNERVKKEKRKKAAKKTSKYVIIPILLLLLLSGFFFTKTKSFTDLINFFSTIIFGNKTVSYGLESETEDYSVGVRKIDDDAALEEGDLRRVSDSEEQARLDELAENSRVYCIISSSPYFASAEEKGALYISNPKESAFYSQVIIVTQDTEEEMYVSPVIAPNEKIEYDYLTNKNFKNGTYKCNALFNYYSKTENDTPDDSDDYNYIGTMCAEVIVVIGE